MDSSTTESFLEASNTCPACGHESLSVLEITKDLRYDLCPKCRLCRKHFQHGNARKDFNIGQTAYYEQDGENPFAEPSVITKERLVRRAAILTNYLQPGNNVLEIGPGGGQIAIWFKQRDCHYIGCEISQTLTNQLKEKGISVLSGEFENTDFTNTYDMVLSFHTIEHVPEPQAQMVKAFSITKPRGCFIIATPNACSWEQRLVPRLSANFDVGHLHVFSPKSLKLMAEASGWQVESYSTSEYTSDWLRIASKILRRIKGEDEVASAGKYSQAATAGVVARIISIIATVTLPARSLQARLRGGNEIIMVLRKPDVANNQG